MSARSVAAIVAGSLLISACGGDVPADLGVTMDRLRPCPESPNCVHTGDRHPDPMEPIMLSEAADRSTVMSQIRSVLESFPRTSVEAEEGPYLHVTFTTLVFRFVDDVELLLQDDGELVIRSASRIGQSDLGANERRVERIRIALRDAGLTQ